MPPNPFTDSAEKSEEVRDAMGVGVGVVIGVSYESHMVGLRELTGTGGDTSGTPTQAAVAVDESGDVSLPSVGDTVVFARFMNRQPVVIGPYYTTLGEIPDTDGSERVVSGSDSIRLSAPYVVDPKRTDDPSDAPDGARWYREDLDEYRGMQNGNIVRFDTTQV